MKTTTTKQEFQAWLKNKKPSALAGFAGNPYSCPLAQFFRSINELKEDQVNIVDIGGLNEGVLILNKEGNEKRENLKPWMKKFIEKVDSWLDDETNKNGSDRISAKKALDILSSC
jgi:hypothetical protein